MKLNSLRLVSAALLVSAACSATPTPVVQRTPSEGTPPVPVSPLAPSTAPAQPAPTSEPTTRTSEDAVDTADLESAPQTTGGFWGYSCEPQANAEFNNPANPHEITNKACGYADSQGGEHSYDPWIEDQLGAERERQAGGDPSPYDYEGNQVPEGYSHYDAGYGSDVPEGSCRVPGTDAYEPC
jgi:hypothetical protein